MYFTTLTYPTEASIINIHTTPALEVWYPTYPQMALRYTLYTFYDREGNIFYTGKTYKGRERFRWHLRNTFKQHKALDKLWLDACSIYLEPKPAPDDWDNYTPEHYEAILIRRFRPMYNRNIKITYLRSMKEKYG